MRRYVSVSESGQALVEAVVAIGIAVLLVTGLVVATTASLRTGQVNRDRSLATQYAQQGMEAVRALRDSSWSTFQGFNGLYCLGEETDFTDTNIWIPSATSVCPLNLGSAATLFRRGVTFTWVANPPAPYTQPRMEATVSVSWGDGSQDHTISLTSYFTQWK